MMQRLPTCKKCHQVYGGKDPVKPHGARMPLILECGHTFCEGCLLVLSKNKDAINCPKCNVATHLNSGEVSVKSLWPDIYIMGILALNRKLSLNQDQLKLNPVGMIQMPKKKGTLPVKKIKVYPCGECTLKEATCFCQKCDAVLCGNCFDKVHSVSKTLRKHQAMAVRQDMMVGEQKTCSEHNRLLEYFCEEDKSLICSHCFIKGSHQSHSITALEEKNAECITDVQSELENVNKVHMLLKHSEKTLMRIAPDMKMDTMQLIDDIKSHFRDLHSVLQSREIKLLNEVEDLLHKETEPLEDIRSILHEELAEIEQIIYQAKKLITSQQDEVLNSHTVLEKMKKAVDISCFVDYNQDASSGFSCSFPEGLEQSLKECGKIEMKSHLNVKLLPLKEVPQATIEELSSCPVMPESISTQASEIADTESITSETSTTSGISFSSKKAQRSRVTSYKQELVYVTHIKNPSYFMVQRLADYDRVTSLNKGIRKFCKGPEGDKAKLATVEVDEVVLCFFKLDSCWYRARVLSVNIATVPMQIEVFYIDYGNSEIVTMDRLLAIQHRFLKIPELCTPCSLCDIMPTDEPRGWTKEATDAFALMTNDKPLVMTLLGNSESMAQVDLSKPGSDDIEDDRPVSVRDALVFMEFATFTSPMSSPMALIGNCRSGGPILYSRRYLTPEMPKSNEKIPVVISHIDSPKDFSVQIAGDDAIYLNQMMNQLQEVYMKDRKGTYSVYVPQVGMICVAQFSDGAWYRAEVVELPGKQMVGVKYVDFGNQDHVHYSKLKKIKDEFLKLPTQAMDCELADVELPVDGVWSEQVMKVLADYYQNNVQLHVQRIIDGKKIMAVLYDKSDTDTPLCINSLLVEKGLAECSGPSSKPHVPSVKKPEIVRQATPPAIVQEYTREISVDSIPSPPAPPVEAPHVKVVVSHIVNPSHLYVQLHTAASDGLLEMMEDLQNVYSSSPPPCNVNWQKGDFCAVCYSRDGRWYRAKIEEISNDVEQVQVHLIDYGYKEIKEKSALRELTESIRLKPCYSVLCHLDDIQPAGDVSKWSQTSIEALREKVDNETLYIVYKDAKGETSLPIDLLVDNHVVGDALSAHQFQYLSLTEWLKEKGLALPKRKNISVQPHEAEANKDMAVTKPIPPPTAAPNVKEVEAKQIYPPPAPPSEKKMQIIPTYVDYDFIIYGQPLYPETSPQGRYGYILKENTIEILLQDNYLESKSLYRAKIPRDGNCLFRCFAQGIWGDQTRYSEMRENVIKGIHENWWLFQNIIGDTDKDNYLKEMAIDGIYGGEPEIQAVCHLFQINARIYLGGLHYGIQEREYGNSTAPRVNLCYVSDGKYDNGHYDLIVEDCGSVALVEKTYNDWRTHKLIELIQAPSNYNTVYYDESLLSQIMEFIQSEFLASLPETNYNSWKTGQAVVARYPDDNLFYRAVINEIGSDSVKVHFIDFGDTKDVPTTDLRKKLILSSVPQQCYRLVLHNLQPLQGTCWNNETLTHIHSMIVNRTCTVTIEDGQYRPGDVLVANVTLPEGMDLAEHLIESGFARRAVSADKAFVSTDGSEVTKTLKPNMDQRQNRVISPVVPPMASSISSSGSTTPVNLTPTRPVIDSNRSSPQKPTQREMFTHPSEGTNGETVKAETCVCPQVPTNGRVQVPEVSSSNSCLNDSVRSPLKRTVESPYTAAKLGRKNDLVPVQVTQVDTPSQVYVQFLNQENPKTSEQKTISKLLDQLLDVQKIINTEMELYPNMEDITPGTACCAKFSADQSWYRAEILESSNEGTGVLFVDYGNSEYVPINSLRQIPDDLLEMPAMAVRCCLEGVNPPAIGSWTTEDTMLMQQCVAGRELLAVIKDLKDCEPLIELYEIEEYKVKGAGSDLVYEPFLKNERNSNSDASVILEECELIGDDEELPHRNWGDMVEEENM